MCAGRDRSPSPQSPGDTTDRGQGQGQDTQTKCQADSEPRGCICGLSLAPLLVSPALGMVTELKAGISVSFPTFLTALPGLTRLSPAAPRGWHRALGHMEAVEGTHGSRGSCQLLSPCRSHSSTSTHTPATATAHIFLSLPRFFHQIHHLQNHPGGANPSQSKRKRIP